MKITVRHSVNERQQEIVSYDIVLEEGDGHYVPDDLVSEFQDVRKLAPDIINRVNALISRYRRNNANN